MAGQDNKALGKAHVPWGSDGSGRYSTATLGCFRVIENSAPLVLNGLDVNAAGSAGAFTVADYGTADGGTSMPLMHKIIQEVRRQDPTREIHIQYEDQPVNDFKSLFAFTEGIMPPREGVDTFKKHHDKVFVTASGTGFFEQCFPSNSVHLGVSFTAMHWLSEKPCDLSTVHMTQASPDELGPWRAQAAKDYERILLARAAELAPGGRLVVVNFCIDDNGYYLGHTDKGPNMFATMNRLWKKMADDGRITQEEFKNTTMCNYYRTKEELVAPFKEGTAVHAAGLRLVSCETRVVRCPFRDAFLDGSGAGGKDPAKHAAWYVPTLRTWSNSTFTTGLDATKRSAEERAALADEMFAMYEKEAAADPEGHGMDYVHGYLVLEKAK
ncbi:unnamed protein product [Pedinophyceae sp. YPF-701]|nr:unnamed protein product [Pedinophyceae sp. YPF-701]